jgi:hypothetical protein
MSNTEELRTSVLEKVCDCYLEEVLKLATRDHVTETEHLIML